MVSNHASPCSRHHLVILIQEDPRVGHLLVAKLPCKLLELERVLGLVVVDLVVAKNLSVYSCKNLRLALRRAANLPKNPSLSPWFSSS